MEKMRKMQNENVLNCVLINEVSMKTILFKFILRKLKAVNEVVLLLKRLQMFF